MLRRVVWDPPTEREINVHIGGEVEVITGGASMGQGFETVIAQVAAETLGAIIAKCVLFTATPIVSNMASARMRRARR